MAVPSGAKRYAKMPRSKNSSHNIVISSYLRGYNIITCPETPIFLSAESHKSHRKRSDDGRRKSAAGRRPKRVQNACDTTDTTDTMFVTPFHSKLCMFQNVSNV